MEDLKPIYMVVYNNNQVPFCSLDEMKAYFENSGNLFDAIMSDFRFFEVYIKPIDSPLNS